jgi:phosphoenolpyruvate synthase/pyruvate phosphate dikinase
VITEDVEESLRHQFSINDEEVMELARYAMIIEQHYGRPMDIEWGKDGIDGKLYILQARPETVQSQAGAGKVEKFKLKPSPRCSPPAAPSARRSVSARSVSSRTRRKWIRSNRVTCSSPT